MMRRLLFTLATIGLAAQGIAAVDPAARGLAAGAARPPLQDGYFRLSAKSDQSFAAWRERSLRINAAAYADSAAGEFYEGWAGLSAWSANSGVQVSGGTLISNGGTGSTGGINHSFAVAAGGKARIVIPVYWKANGGGGGLIVGVSGDAAGAVPAANGSSAKGIYLNGTSVSSWNLGTATAIATGLTSGADTSGVVTITIDPATISIVYAVTGSTTEYRTMFSRSGFTINNLYFLLTNSATYEAVKPLAARMAMSTTTPALGIEKAGRAIQWTTLPTLSGSANIKVVTPPGYDSRYPWPAVLMLHGNGSSENLFSDNAGQQAAYSAFLAAGYVLVSASDTSSGSTWGAQKSLDAYYAAAQFVRDNYSIGSIGIYANSMGGIESELLLADRRIPGIAWWIGMSPTYNLADAYAPQPGFTDFSATINTAYGAASYAAVPGGHDPALIDPRGFRGVPMMILAAGDDVTVNPVANGQALARAVAPYAPELVAPSGISGGHAFGLAPYTAAMIAFANRYSGN